MAKNLNYDSKDLLNYKFSPKEKGYDPLQVDQVFDKIIEDYKAFVSNLDELKLVKDKQAQKIEEMKKELDKISFELASTKKQFDDLKKISGINEDNYKLAVKISAYERALHRKGVDLKKALSDPDNC